MPRTTSVRVIPCLLCMLLENGVDETVDLADGETPALRSELEVDLGVQIVPSFDLLDDVADLGDVQARAVALDGGEEFGLGLHALILATAPKIASMCSLFFLN